MRAWARTWPRWKRLPVEHYGPSVTAVAAFCLLFVSMTACGSGGSRSPAVSAVPLVNAKNSLLTPTYDGSGQSVEPDVTVFVSPWHGFKYWMVYSPYPNGNERDENPSILASNDGVNWQVPSGLVNPLALPSANDLYLADASLFYDPKSDQLWVYYIDVFKASMNMRRLTSPDGVNWRDDGVVFTEPDYDILSPTVSVLGDTYYMWTINSGSAGCTTTTGTAVEYRTSLDGIHWSAPQPSDMAQPGYFVWHINGKWIPSKQEFWVVAAAFPRGTNCAATVLFFLTSQDGVRWTSYNRIALNKGTTWDQDEIYRSTLWYDSSTDRLSVWYSARGGVPPTIPYQAGEWHVGLTQDDYVEFAAWLRH